MSTSRNIFPQLAILVVIRVTMLFKLQCNVVVLQVFYLTNVQLILCLKYTICSASLTFFWRINKGDALIYQSKVSNKKEPLLFGECRSRSVMGLAENCKKKRTRPIFPLYGPHASSITSQIWKYLSSLNRPRQQKLKKRTQDSISKYQCYVTHGPSWKVSQNFKGILGSHIKYHGRCFLELNPHKYIFE